MVLTFFIVMFVLMMNLCGATSTSLVGKGTQRRNHYLEPDVLRHGQHMIPMGLPLSMLLAAIMTMGNLGENYEPAGHEVRRDVARADHQTADHRREHRRRGGFFISNNLVPYSNKKMFSIIYDIRQQKQSPSNSRTVSSSTASTTCRSA